jgi:glyoxylase-like metal-dependent hydrolase (beta-lactamase superfamily II)/rhodanese-related sulfurtransferase
MFCCELNLGQCKTYLLACERTRKAVLIDPLRERVDRYLAVLAYHGCRLEFIVDTHTHADHRSGIWDLQELTGAQTVMHREAPAPRIDLHVEDGQELRLGKMVLTVMHTPGHTPDGISILTGDRVFTGDTLLIGGSGRCDFAGGDPGAEYDSVTEGLFSLPDCTLVLPAHDYRGHQHSTIGVEKQSNQRFAGRSRADYIKVMNSLGLPLPQKIQEALQANQSAIEDESVNFPSIPQLSQVRQLEPLQLYAMLKQGEPPVLLDVREESEFGGDLGHIPGSKLIPLKELPARAEEAGAKNHEIVTICRAGMRSTTAAAILTGLGFEHVSNLKGGMLAWDDQKLPVEEKKK